MINSIDSVFVDASRTVYVSAFVEGAVQTFSQTLYDPPEYGPALCEASFELQEDEDLPEDDDKLIKYLEDLDLDWSVVDMSDY